MDKQFQEHIDYTKEKYGLSAYTLKNHIFTHDPLDGYVFLSEWLPSGVVSHDKDRNPDGTAIVSLNYHTKALLSIVFIGEAAFPDQQTFPKNETSELIEWIEDQTGLIYGKQYQQVKQKDDSVTFEAAVDEISVAPAGKIEIRFNTNGQMTSFLKSGYFPTESSVEMETFSLTKEKVTDFTSDALLLRKIPLEKEEEWVPFYFIEESFIKNDATERKISDSINEYAVYYEVDFLLNWSTPVSGNFTKQEVEIVEEASIEDALVKRTHPDHKELSEADIIAIVQESARIVQLTFPEEPNKWRVHRIFREYEHIFSEVVPADSDKIYERKLKIILNDELHALNVVDNDILYQLLGHFKVRDTVEIKPEAALALLAEEITLDPVFVYNRETKTYQIHGALSCPSAVNAITGEVVSLDTLLN